MDKNLGTKIDILADASNARNEIGRFESSFSRAMREIGKTPAEIKSIRALAKEIRAGAKSADGLDEELRELVETYNQMRTLADARHTLNIIPHDRITKEINEVKAAYDTLKRSGKLTETELAQAALKTQQKINQLKADTNGWVEAMETAKGSLASLAISATGLTLAAKKAVTFESAMADVAKVVNGSSEEIETLASGIKDLSDELPQSAEGLAQIAAQGGQLGIPIENLTEFTRLAGVMGTAFGLSAEEAGNAVAKLSNVFDLPLESVAGLGDAINVLGNNTAATEAKILEALGRIGGTSKQFGLAADQAAALAASMIALGKSPEVAATGINALLSKLQTANVQGDSFQEALEGIGISARDLARDIAADPQRALNDFLATLQDLDKQSRAETLTQLFGQEYQDDISLLVGSLGQYGKALDLVAGKQGQVAGAMEEEFKTRMETTAEQLKLLSNAVDKLAINLGSVFLPVIAEVGGGMADATNAIAGFVEKFPAISGLAAMLGTLLPALTALKIGFKAMELAATKGVAATRAKLALLRVDLADTKKSVGLLNTAFNVLGAGLVGWEIGTYLRDEFELVERAGNDLARSVHLVIATMNGLSEIARAPFNGDTMLEAYNRLRQEIAKINTGYNELNQFIGQDTDAKRKNTEATVGAAGGNKALADSQEDLSGSTERAKEAAEDLAAAYDTLGVESVASIQKSEQQITSAFRTIADGATTTGTDIYNALNGALANVSQSASIDQLRETLETAFVAGRIGAEEYGRALELLSAKLAELDRTSGSLGRLSTAFEKLGVKSAASLQEMDKQITESFKTIAESAEVTGGDIVSGFDAALGKINTSAGLSALSDTLKGAFDSGKISVTEYEQKVASLEKKLVDLSRVDLTRAFNAGEISASKYTLSLDALEKKQAELNKSSLSRSEALKKESDAQKDADGSSKDHVKALAELAKQYRNGDISAEEYWEATKKVDEENKKVKESTEEAGEATEEAGDKAEETGKKLQSVSIDMAAFAQAQGVGAEASQSFAKVYAKLKAELEESWSRQPLVTTNMYLNDMKRMERAAIDATKRLEDLDRQMETLGDDSASGVEDLRLRLLELEGTEQEIAEARQERERKELQREMEILKIKQQQADIVGDDAAAAGYRKEAQYKQQEIGLLRQVQAAEDRQRREQAQQNQVQPKNETRVTLQAPDGTEVSGDFSENDAEKFIQTLQAAGMRTVA